MTATTNNSRYVPDLQGFLVLCELNYARLVKLLPVLEPAGTYFDYWVNDTHCYRLTINECCKYTTMLSIVQLQPQLQAYLTPSLDVRLYHDANLAEVSASQNISRIKGSYHYPNPDMMQKDEKHQVNRFLNQWLKLCLDYGQVQVDLSSYG